MRRTWLLAPVACLLAVPAFAETVVERKVTTETKVDCASLADYASRLACYQQQAYVPPVTTTERTVESSDGTTTTYRSVETNRVVAPLPNTTTHTVTTTTQTDQ